jgi:hypothetical protein
MLLRLCEALDLEALAMTRPTVGGSLNYAVLAQLHKPTDPRAIAVEIRRMHAGGLKPRDVAVALRLDLSQVLEAIGEKPADPISPQSNKAPTT